MTKIGRRAFLQAAAIMGASPAWAGADRPSRTNWREQRDLFPEGVASGDPSPDSVILWTRRPFSSGDRHIITVEVALDSGFRNIVATAPVGVNAAADWTCRALVGNLKPARTYWYRFTDEEGAGSRIGRTRTAPSPNDARPVNFAFVSCQDLNEGKLNAYRRMIFEDERAAPADQLDFVLHLGDFIYEVVQYPEEVKSRYDRTIYEVARIADGRKVAGNFHIPLTLDGYRAVYKGYLADPDLQDARARWPFVAIWDNHEFSWQGWQSMVVAPPFEQPGQSIKIAANQAWFEFLPSRVSAPSGSLERFDPPVVTNAPIDKFDDDGLGVDPNNLIAINSLIAYRALRYGRHLDLIITDQHSFRGESPFNDPSLDKFGQPEYRGMYPEKIIQIVEGGRAYDGGKPPAELRLGDVQVPNPRRTAPPQTILGAKQKVWFKDRLRRSTATWKIWGNSQGALDVRADPQNLPAGMVKSAWPQGTYGWLGQADYGAAYTERSEIYDLVKSSKITGFAIVSGDRHSFWAGYASAQLPPGKFEPVGLSFVGGSLISPGAMESFEHNLKKDAPLRSLFLADRPDGQKPDWTYNMLLKHGVRSCLEYAKSFDKARALSLSNPDLAPHLEFVDAGGHGYAKVRLSADEMRTEFVCIPRPITRSERPDGGPLRYRVAHTAKLWAAGERPRLSTAVLEGDVGLSM
jgi:alkaline phosphatase D